MVNFTIDEVRLMMNVRHNIRNISVIAHVDHGKSTLTDSLIGHAGIIAQAKAGDTRFMDTREDEQDRTITIKSTGVSLFFSIAEGELEGDVLKMAQTREKGAEMKLVDEGKHPYLVNLIDSPGHVDFSSEVTAALRVTDGALVVVDCIEGVCVQTETVLRQAIAERIRPILFVNKLDRIFLELHMDPEEAYQTFNKAVESVNVVIATYNDELLGDVQVYPEAGTVGFGSGLHGWGFTIKKFAQIYAKKFGIDLQKMMSKLWGEHFFKGKKWSKKQHNKDGSKNKRAFVQFILEPIQQLFKHIMDDNKDTYLTMCKKLGITIPKDAKELVRKPLLKRIMQTWLPAADSLIDMIVNHLPSPADAQKYRVENLYSGPCDDEAALAIKNCDPEGHLMMYISKMIPTSEKGRFYAFGRVFSGTVKTGQTVRIQGPAYELGSKTDLNVKKVQRCVVMMGRFVEQVPDCPCGNTIGLVGIDAYLLKSGTITTYDKAHNFVDMKYSVSPVVRVAVEVCNASDLPKLMEGLKRLAKSDPLVQCMTSKTGEHIVAGCGELHIEVCLKDLREQYMKGAPIKTGEPVVSFCETILAESSKQCVSKSPNKHNRIYMSAEPLGKELVNAIEEKVIQENEEMKVRARKLIDDFGWDKDYARKIWTFGCPPDARSNLLVDCTKGVQYLNEIKDSCVGAFMQTTAGGVFCDEAMRGGRFNIEDVTLHADAIHRGAGQIMPVMRRVMYACQIKSEPALLEPMYLCDITVPRSYMNGVYTALSARRGEVESNEQQAGTPLCKVKAYLPVLESFGFTSLLRQNTSGQAFPQLIFSHWEIMKGDLFEEDSKLYNLYMAIRKRKGMKEAAPDFGDFYDKI